MKADVLGRAIPSGEPRVAIPALAPFYAHVRDLSYPLIRLTAGGVLLVHGIVKLTSPGVIAFATGLARRGLEPSVPFVFLVLVNERVFVNERGCVICRVPGLFARPAAAGIAVEVTVITVDVHFKDGFGFTSPGGGREYPVMWGRLTLAIALRRGGPCLLDRRLGTELWRR